MTVIARESSEARRALVIDRGEADGIEVGQVVIALGGALAGRVVEVGPNFAHVVLISDATSTVIGQLFGSAATGRSSGGLGGALVMGDVNSAAAVNIGEEVFTAGIELGGGIRSPYPEGPADRPGRRRRPRPERGRADGLPAARGAARPLEFLLVITNYEGGIIGPIETGVPCDPTDDGTLPDSDQPCASRPPRPAPPLTAGRPGVTRRVAPAQPKPSRRPLGTVANRTSSTRPPPVRDARTDGPLRRRASRPTLAGTHRSRQSE